MREERVRNKTKNGGVRSLREERVRNRTKNGRVRSLREERVRNRTKAGGVRSLRQERVRIRGLSTAKSTFSRYSTTAFAIKCVRGASD